MKLTCVHCGDQFVITADQLGKRGKCPHCRATIILPKAQTSDVPAAPLEAPRATVETSFATIGSILLHLLVLGVLALIPWGSGEEIIGAEGELVTLAVLPNVSMTENDDSQFHAESASAMSGDLMHHELIEEPFAPQSKSSPTDHMLDVPTRLFGDRPADDQHDVRARIMDASVAEDFGQLVSRLNRDGLDLVIVFDSTGSMEGEINEVKDKIQRIGATLFRLVPRTRISLVTYRDEDDEYVVKGLSFTDNLGDVVRFLDDVRAAGGGDEPEAVDAGLAWAMENNYFRPQSRKVMLVFGDAPPHAHRKARCLKLAADFRLQYGGIVSTITCRRSTPLDDFLEIAQMGGGEAFLTRHERELMTQLVVLVFGAQHREKVLEAFDLLSR